VFEPDAVVHANTSIRGRSRICANASIGPNARLRDAVVGEGAVVDAAVVEGTTLAAGTHVGPFSHVRAGSFLDEGAYVGTHVEVKASRLGRGSHVGHFSYVGDAVVGADVNVGAGTVTCNYDGVTKHVTEIEDAAFIGSDTLLIAPVRIGARAVTGAGSVVTRDVAPGERVAGVPARRMEGQKRRAAAIESEGGQTLG
jgi:bifunctional UDP-N-acetylglucosamine pyrophosphorylase/glucosamine-1-phosphate N-acetyltransferase